MDGPNPQDVFRIPGYLAFWSAYTVSGFGTYITTLALQLAVSIGYQPTLWISIAGFVAAAVFLAASPFRSARHGDAVQGNLQ